MTLNSTFFSPMNAEMTLNSTFFFSPMLRWLTHCRPLGNVKKISTFSVCLSFLIHWKIVILGSSMTQIIIIISHINNEWNEYWSNNKETFICTS